MFRTRSCTERSPQPPFRAAAASEVDDGVALGFELTPLANLAAMRVLAAEERRAVGVLADAGAGLVAAGVLFEPRAPYTVDPLRRFVGALGEDLHVRLLEVVEQIQGALGAVVRGAVAIHAGELLGHDGLEFLVTTGDFPRLAEDEPGDGEIPTAWVDLESGVHVRACDGRCLHPDLDARARRRDLSVRVEAFDDRRRRRGLDRAAKRSDKRYLVLVAADPRLVRLQFVGNVIGAVFEPGRCVRVYHRVSSS